MASRTGRENHCRYLLRLADTALVLGHRISEWSSRGPTLEEDIALSNIALDQIGLARSLYVHIAELEGRGRSEDDLAYLRDAPEFLNLLLVEQQNGDFARTMARQVFYSAFAVLQWSSFVVSADETLAAIAAKAHKEAIYHLRHSSEWLIRLGDGTKESHRRAQCAVDELYMYTGEMFEMDGLDRTLLEQSIGIDASLLLSEWSDTLDSVLEQATLIRPENGWMIEGGRRGRHSEHLGHLLAEMQFLQRAYPGADW